MLPNRKLITDWLVYVLVRVIVCVVQAIPIESCAKAADIVAWLAYRKLQIRRKITDENLACAFPEKTVEERNEIAHKMWRHIILLVCELVHSPRKIHRNNWYKYIRTIDADREVAYMLSNRPVIVVSGHFGSFEVGGQFNSLLGYPTFSVARTLDNPFLDRFIKQFREATGQHILPKKGSSPQVDQVLSSGGTLMILGDQSAGPKGCWIEFFGRLASCHKSVALFSLTQNAPMVFGYSMRVDDKPMQFEIGVVGVYDPERDGKWDVERLSQWYSSMLETVIRKAPEQYWWLHRRWRDPPARVLQRQQRKLAAANDTSVTTSKSA